MVKNGGNVDTIGSLIDKLTIANIRLWHLEDIRRDLSLSDKERLKACDQISVVNKQRNNLIDEIDNIINESIQRGGADVFEKNKLY